MASRWPKLEKNVQVLPSQQAQATEIAELLGDYETAAKVAGLNGGPRSHVRTNLRARSL